MHSYISNIFFNKVLIDLFSKEDVGVPPLILPELKAMIFLEVRRNAKTGREVAKQNFKM